MAKSKKPFAVEVEVKLTVFAFDEASARKKASEALHGGRPIAADVVADEVFLYDVTRRPKQVAS